MLRKVEKVLSENKAKQVIQDAAMRRRLYEFLWEGTLEAKKGWPCPALGDGHRRRELQRVLGGKSRLFGRIRGALSENEAIQATQDAEMRRKLYEFLWEATAEARNGRPCVELGPEDIRRRLQRILG